MVCTFFPAAICAKLVRLSLEHLKFSNHIVRTSETEEHRQICLIFDVKNEMKLNKKE
jgi:hypothetical protein